MDITNPGGREKRIWQAIAHSGMNISSIAKADLEKLVDTVEQEVLEEFDDVVGQSRPAAATASPLGHDRATFAGVWETGYEEGSPLPIAGRVLHTLTERIRVISGLLGHEHENAWGWCASKMSIGNKAWASGCSASAISS